MYYKKFEKNYNLNKGLSDHAVIRRPIRIYMNIPQSVQKYVIVQISPMPARTFQISMNPSLKRGFALASRIASFCALASLLFLQIMTVPPRKVNLIEVTFYVTAGVLIPYFTVAFQRGISYYRPYKDSRLNRRIPDATGHCRAWILHRESGDMPKLFAKGTSVLPIALMKGNLSVLKEDELFAVIAHEIGHNRYWHYPVYLATGFLLLYLLSPYGPAGIVFAVIAARLSCYLMEAQADKYVYRLGLEKHFLSALMKIDDNERHAWTDYVPFLNLLVIYPRRGPET